MNKAENHKIQQNCQLTFELCSAGVDVHPFLAFSAAHQKTGHCLTWKKCISLCNLTKNAKRSQKSFLIENKHLEEQKITVAVL